MLILNKWCAFFNPEQFQGWGRKRRYFEGWYYKLINADETRALAVIPGIAMDETGKKQAFIQVLDGRKHTSQYFRFDAEQFRPQAQKFQFSIAGNHFSADTIHLELPALSGELHFSGMVPWPKPWHSPGIMGPYAFVPFMECYHGIVSMDHSIRGKLLLDGEDADFSGGRGYTEKDWGRSFPSAYIWMQSNHFSRPRVSLKVSVAKIPWIRKAFVGFIAGLWLEGRLIRFTTYNKSILRKSSVSSEMVELIIENPSYRLVIRAYREKATELASPIHGFMEGRIKESMTSTIDVELLDRKREMIIFKDTGRNAGLEVAGNIQEIIL